MPSDFFQVIAQDLNPAIIQHRELALLVMVLVLAVFCPIVGKLSAWVHQDTQGGEQ